MGSSGWRERRAIFDVGVAAGSADVDARWSLARGAAASIDSAASPDADARRVLEVAGRASEALAIGVDGDVIGRGSERLPRIVRAAVLGAVGASATGDSGFPTVGRRGRRRGAVAVDSGRVSAADIVPASSADG